MKHTKPKTKTYRTIIGNALMGGAVFILFIIYFPFLSLYFNPPRIDRKSLQKGEYIIIPKINAQAKIIENVNPWNEQEYGQALQKGVAHAKGTAIPGQKGTIFLFAHSSEDPWKMTRENISFFRLGELNKNDEISIFKNGKKYSYKIYDKKEVWPSEVEYLLNDRGNVLILQTCTPIGTSLKRLLVFAIPQ